MPAPSVPVGEPAEHPRGTAVLLLGILSLVVCGVVGPIAWKLGNDAQRDMEARPDVFWTNRASVTAGRLCGMVGSGFLALLLAFVLFAVVNAVVNL